MTALSSITSAKALFHESVDEQMRRVFLFLMFSGEYRSFRVRRYVRADNQVDEKEMEISEFLDHASEQEQSAFFDFVGTILSLQ
jgi:hypothetical protein